MSNAPVALIAAERLGARGSSDSKLLPGITNVAAVSTAAWFQCVRVGRDLPAKRAYAAASYQLIPPTGRSSLPGGGAPASHVAGAGRPVRSTKRAMAASHGTIRPSRMNGSVHSSRRS
jgi:hypothetical protein